MKSESNLAKIKQALVRIENNNGIKFKLDKHAGGVRIVSEDEGRNISPRLAPKDLVRWVEGFEEGMERVKTILFKEI